MGKASHLSRVTCAVLAGGRSRRMGVDKAFLDLAGRPLIAWTLDRLSGLGQEMLIVANEPERYAGLDARVVKDLIPGAGVLGGLHSAIYHAEFDLVLVVGCDMPFLSRPLLRYQLVLAQHYDVVVPRLNSWFEPLHAAYTRACVAPLGRLAEEGGHRIIELLQEVRVRYVEPAEIDMLDPQRLSFVNANTPEDMERVRRLAGELARPDRGSLAG